MGIKLKQMRSENERNNRMGGDKYLKINKNKR